MQYIKYIIHTYSHFPTLVYPKKVLKPHPIRCPLALANLTPHLSNLSFPFPTFISILNPNRLPNTYAK